MRFDNYLTEFAREHYGAGITFIDIDETVFRTFAKILVKKGGKVVRELDNQEFNSYELKEGESYDFHQFKDAELFAKTSIPILLRNISPPLRIFRITSAFPYPRIQLFTFSSYRTRRTLSF